MNPLKRLTITALLATSFLVPITSCKRISNNKRAEQSATPAAGTASPAPCSIPFNGDFVNDTAGVLNDDSRTKLEQKLDTLKSVGKIDFSVVTVKTTNEQAIAEHSLALARCWSIGEGNPDSSGMLLMLAVEDRKWHMQVSRSIEKVLSNDEIQNAGSQMTPHLRVHNYSEGIDKFVDATINIIAPRKKFSMNVSQP